MSEPMGIGRRVAVAFAGVVAVAGFLSWAFARAEASDDHVL